jgi:hypothetical protein
VTRDKTSGIAILKLDVSTGTLTRASGIATPGKASAIVLSGNEEGTRVHSPLGKGTPRTCHFPCHFGDYAGAMGNPEVMCQNRLSTILARSSHSGKSAAENR